MAAMKIKKTGEDYAIIGISYLILFLFALITFFPFINVVCKAFSEEWAVVSGQVGLLPVGFQFDTMKYVVSSDMFLNAFKMSLIVTVLGTLLGVFMTALVAYPLSKKHMKGIKLILFLFVFTMLFHGGLVPTYLLIKKLGIYNTAWSLILPGAISVYNMLIIKNYYESLPESLEESARIDGAGNLRIFFSLIVPPSKPVLAAITLFTAVGLWNEYFNAMVYITSTELKTLPLYLRDIIVDAASGSSADQLMNMPGESVRAATIIASAVPILCVYPFVQKYFMKGILIGSVKG